jgi:hypothetical protein
MRFKAALGALFLLAGCAATTPTTQAPATESAPRGSGASAALLARAGGGDAPSQQEVIRVLGQADITRQDGVGVAMTYRLDSCALLLLFAADSRNAMRLREAHASARRAGEATPGLDQCGAEADSRRR